MKLSSLLLKPQSWLTAGGLALLALGTTSAPLTHLAANQKGVAARTYSPAPRQMQDDPEPAPAPAPAPDPAAPAPAPDPAPAPAPAPDPDDLVPMPITAN